MRSSPSRTKGRTARRVLARRRRPTTIRRASRAASLVSGPIRPLSKPAARSPGGAAIGKPSRGDLPVPILRRRQGVLGDAAPASKDPPRVAEDALRDIVRRARLPPARGSPPRATLPEGSERVLGNLCRWSAYLRIFYRLVAQTLAAERFKIAPLFFLACALDGSSCLLAQPVRGQFFATPIFGLPPADKWTGRKLYVYIAPITKWRSENKRLSQNMYTDELHSIMRSKRHCGPFKWIAKGEEIPRPEDPLGIHVFLPVWFGKDDGTESLVNNVRRKRSSARLIVNKVKSEPIVQGTIVGRFHHLLGGCEQGFVGPIVALGEDLVTSVLDLAGATAAPVCISASRRAVKAIRPDNWLPTAVKAVGVHLTPGKNSALDSRPE